MDTPPSANLRSRVRPAAMAPPREPSPPRLPKTTPARGSRNPPFLPTPFETAVLTAYPILLLFGALFSLLNPQTWAAPYDFLIQAYSQDPTLTPGYFARKDNLLNIFFVKRGWFWISTAFGLFLFTHPALASAQAKARAGLRWALVTAWWVLVTQWCFGPAIIDRGFRYTGGKCEVVEAKVEAGEAKPVEVFTAVACKSAGGQWRGGHVFLLVLGSFFLVQEVGWVARRWRAGRREERSVVMLDGAVKSAEVEAERRDQGAGDALGIGGKFAAGVVVLSGWMLLMTAIYFHTWFEKLTGLLVSLTGLYVVYILPRWIPPIRAVVGLPGI